MLDYELILVIGGSKMNTQEKEVSEVYENYDEDQRLVKSKSAQIEFLTTAHYIEMVLQPGMKILDLGAGTGVYSLYFAEKGYDVTSVEIVKKHVDIFQSKIKPAQSITLYHGSALDLSMLEDSSFDVVLVFGPLYHLSDERDCSLCLREALRVLKPDGKIFVSYINHDIIHLSELKKDYDFFASDIYDHETMRINNFPFVFLNIAECREMLQGNGVCIEKEIASDGLSVIMQEYVDRLSASSYQQYLKYHFSQCEKKELLSATGHFLFQGKKQ